MFVFNLDLFEIPLKKLHCETIFLNFIYTQKKFKCPNFASTNMLKGEKGESGKTQPAITRSQSGYVGRPDYDSSKGRGRFDDGYPNDYDDPVLLAEISKRIGSLGKTESPGGDRRRNGGLSKSTSIGTLGGKESENSAHNTGGRRRRGNANTPKSKAGFGGQDVRDHKDQTGRPYKRYQKNDNRPSSSSTVKFGPDFPSSPVASSAPSPQTSSGSKWQEEPPKTSEPVAEEWTPT
jgi:hypothetical protein